jgi:hypothetical protein
MKNQIQSLKPCPAPRWPGENGRTRGMDATQFAANLKSSARRAAAASSEALAPHSAFGCVDWFHYPESVPDDSTSADASQS